MSTKPQATMKDDTPKKPVSERIGSRLTKITMGAAFLAGRTAYRTTKGLAKGAAEAGREIKRGYDEAESVTEE